MAQVPGRKLPLETFHQVVLTDDQLHVVLQALRELQDRYELERPDLPEVETELALIDQVVLHLDGVR